MTTYVIAHCDGVLWALARDDDNESLKRQLARFRDQLDMFEMGERGGDLTIERGLILDDKLEYDDDLIWSGEGELRVEPGQAFRYAVRRGKEKIMEQMRETIQHLIDLDEPEALIEALKRAAERKQGERWQRLAKALAQVEQLAQSHEAPPQAQPVEDEAKSA
jgi:hypothetical protein